MRPRHPQVAFSFFALVLGILVLATSGGPDALAQRKGGGGEKAGKGPKDAPAPNLTLPDAWVKSFQWRGIGPANMGGRITAISVFEADPSTYWAATASGGLIKTTNNGVTFEHQFDRENTVSIGDVCVAPSDKSVVWVGTGENNPRNSVSYGDGVYKSTDGGKSWKNMGLKKTHQTGKILIHPTNPDIVYVGALGRCYGPNEERGLFKTTDGGKNWDKILYVDDKTGVIDARMDPKSPDTLYVATWERQRDEYDSWPGGGLPDGYDTYDPVKKWGKGSGIHKTTDGGKSFKKLTKGLPTNAMGRIGLDMYAKDTKVLFAIIDCEKIGMGTPPKKGTAASNADVGLRADDVGEDGGAKVMFVIPEGPADKAGVEANDVILKMADKNIKSNADVVAFVNGAKVGDKVKIELKRNEKMETVEVTLGERPQPKGGGGGGGGGFGGPGGGTGTRPYAANYGGQAPNIADQGKDSHEYGGVYKSTDGGESWTRINSVNPRPMYFSLIRVDPSDDKHIFVGGVSMYYSSNGGKSFQSNIRGIHADHHALWIDPKDGRHLIVGTDGGFYGSYDRGARWDHYNNLALGQFYHVAVCSKKPYWIYGGLQDNGCWGIPSMSLRGNGPVNEDVISINSGDGYVCRVDPNDPDQIYAESQNGGMVRYNLRTNERASLKPGGGGFGGGGGGAAAKGELPKGPMPKEVIKGDNPKVENPKKEDPKKDDAKKEDLKKDDAKGDFPKAEVPKGDPGAGGEGAPGAGRGGQRYRFNWNTPYILSNHNSLIWYCASNFVHKSVHKGDDAKIISPDITRTKHGSATALAESPRNPDLLWVGTDDGYLWITRNGGREWKNVTEKLGLKKPMWISTIEASRFAEGRAFVAIDAHRCDDDDPYLFMTDDYGQTWKSIKGNLPMGSTRCLREDITNPNLLYCGTEFALHVSLDRGGSWTKINNNLPTVAVHEVAIHPTAGEIVAATHGRSLWILDVTPLRQMATEAVKEKSMLYKPNTVVRWQDMPSRGRSGRQFIGENPPRGAQIFYSLPKNAMKVSLVVQDIDGNKVAELTGPTAAGLNKVVWNTAQRPAGGAAAGAGAGGGRPGGGGAAGAGGGGGGGRGQGGLAGGRQVPAGAYRLVLNVDGQEMSQSFHIEGDPMPLRSLSGEDDDLDEDKDR